MTNLKKLYEEHIQKRMNEASKAMAALNYQTLIIGSGTPTPYFEDDYDSPFKTNPHFAHWCPAKGPFHLLKFEPGKKPILAFYSPDDFWHIQEKFEPSYWGDMFEVKVINDKTKLWAALGNTTSAVFVGNDTKWAEVYGVKTNCALLTARLNWYRRYKSEYEVLCLSEANKLAAKGHQVAKDIFIEGGSEYEIHMAYLLAMQASDSELPYGSIVALNKNAAILHYHGKQNTRNGNLLLIDSGASYQNYGSDITRTYATQNSDPIFLQILDKTISMQKQLANDVKPGTFYPELHEKCHLMIAKILEETGVLNLQGNYQMAFENGLTKTFLPHGLGHMLGIQVHDIGGKQLDEQGNVLQLKKNDPNYRTLRFIGTLEENVVVTIEPGIYFIPLLLDKLKEDTKLSHHVNWNIIDKLIPYGGIRIEDDVLVTKDGNRNLTREVLP